MTEVVDFDAWTVVHELAHAWDNHFGNWPSAQLETSTGGSTDPQHRYPDGCAPYEPGCNDAGYYYGGKPPKGSDNYFNRWEDFAESVTAYVFPVQAQLVVEELYRRGLISRDLHYPDYTQTERWQFVHTLINGNTGQ
jgi:hypothetical protein